MLRRFQAMQSVIRPILQGRLDVKEQEVLNGFTNYINHSWNEAKQTLGPDQHDELHFHLIVIVKQTERVHQLIAKAKDIASQGSKRGEGCLRRACSNGDPEDPGRDDRWTGARAARRLAVSAPGGEAAAERGHRHGDAHRARRHRQSGAGFGALG